MRKPLDFLVPVMDLLGQNLQVLPALGGATEELLRPDVDETEDALLNRDCGEITEFAETPTPTPATLYCATPPVFRKDRHLFRFFIDGSLRTYFLGTAVEGQRAFPLQLAQIGSAVMCRDDEGHIWCHHHRQKVILLVPTQQFGISDTVWQQLQRLNTPDGGFEVVDITKPTATTPHESHANEDLRTRGGGVARHRMHLMEVDAIKTTDPLRGDDSWLILDGSVKLDQFINAPYLIGVAKSFSKEPQFRFGRGHTHRQNITSILARLQFAHRTAAFSAHGGKVAFWYVRLRPQGEVDYPLMGVVKVELPTPDGKPVDSELLDLLSSALVAERNCTPYGKDSRWHCHLYPIYLAEQVIKNRFYSQEVLLGAIRWPSPNV